MVINVYEAKTRLSELLDRVGRGEEIVLGRSGRPVARLVPYRPQRDPRVPTPDELLDAFEGRQ